MGFHERLFTGADALAFHHALHRHGLSAGLHGRFDNAFHGGPYVGDFTLTRTHSLPTDHRPGKGVILSLHVFDRAS